MFASYIWFLIAILNFEFWHCVYPMFKTCPEQNQTSPKRTSSRRMEWSPSATKMLLLLMFSSATKMEQRSPALIGSSTIDHSAPSEAHCHHLGRSIFWMGRRLQCHKSLSEVILLNIPCPLSTYWGRGGGGGKARLTRDLHSHLKYSKKSFFLEIIVEKLRRYNSSWPSCSCCWKRFSRI